MISEKDILADLHVHSIASVHAYSTITECIQAAAKRGLKYIAITDHYFNEGSPVQRKNEVNGMAYMEEWVNPNEYGVHVIGGGEFNLNHELFSSRLIRRLKWRLYGCHSWYVDRPNTTLGQLFSYFADGVGRFNAFAHIEREIHVLDHGKHGSNLDDEVKDFLHRVVDLAFENKIVLEVNEASLLRDEGGNASRLRYWLSYAKEKGNLISMGSDAHYHEHIGKFDLSLALLNDIDFPKERIINCNEELLRSMLL